MRTESQPGDRQSFGEMHFGNAQLKDPRRTERLITVADAIVRHPGGSLPEKFRSPARLDPPPGYAQAESTHLRNVQDVPKPKASPSQNL